MGALAQFELSLIAERTRAGMAAAKRRGQKLGRRRKLTVEQIRHARQLIVGGESPGTVARSRGVGRSTLYEALKASPGR
jgi:DNA invertase Pin-like site-specific DNA recombinase